MGWPDPPRGLGIIKPHISFARFGQGHQMVEVRSWPNWPDIHNAIFAAGASLAEAWDHHLEAQEYEENSPQEASDA